MNNHGNIVLGRGLEKVGKAIYALFLDDEWGIPM